MSFKLLSKRVQGSGANASGVFKRNYSTKRSILCLPVLLFWETLNRGLQMKIRWSITSISALLLSLCLMTFIPVGLKFASTWREPYFEGGSFKEQNHLMPMGFSSLGFVFPGNVLPPLLINMQNGGDFQWSYWFGTK
ncbi:MAG TPA: hypothetical protein VNU92_11590 [Edaphobacter sp.]|nr:hypothetical protein [Edaphobacter sp.]